MKVTDWLRRIRFNPVLIKLARFFRLHRLIRMMYYKFILFAGNKIKIRLFGYEAQFYARDLAECSDIENFLNDEWQENRVIEKIFLELRPQDVAYDIGASVGTHSIFMALKISSEGRVFAFEPELDSFKRLKDNILLNKIKNITPLQLALGDYSGEVSIRKMVCFVISNDDNFELANKAKLVKGDNFIKENNLLLPNIVKIDVEGFEYNVIKGLESALRDKACRMVVCEIHPAALPAGVKVDDLIGLLDSYGFKRKQIFKRITELHAFFYKV